jgi:hypothetical protein
MGIIFSFSTTVDALSISVFNTNVEIRQAAASIAAAFLQQTIRECNPNVILVTNCSDGILRHTPHVYLYLDRDSAALAFPNL